MPKVGCSVNTCSYNQSGACYASIINIGGKGASHEKATSCGSFLNRLGYSDLAEYTSMRGDVDAILCRVDTCTYYNDDKCTLQEIQVGGQNEAEIYIETDCLSYNKK